MILLSIILVIVTVRHVVRVGARSEYLEAKKQLQRHYFDSVLGGYKPNTDAYLLEISNIEKEIERLS